MKATKRNWLKRVFALALMLTLVFGMNVTTAYAAPGEISYTGPEGLITDPTTYVPSTAGISDGTISITEQIEDVNGNLLDKAKYVIKIKDGKIISSTLPADVFTAIEVDANGTQQALDAIENIKDLTNVNPDLKGAQGTLAPIIEIVNTVIGILATAILILIGLFTAIDILYLEVPTFHNSMDQKAMEKGQTNKSGGVKAKIVSEDASQAYQEATETGKNVLIVYLKKRIVAYIAVAIVLYMLLSGNLSLIVEVVLKMLNGVFGWVEEYSSTM